jgi:glycosyltransferase EpsE
MPKVSVIMGAYNCQSTIKKAIDSIRSQTFKDWEFLVCDDASVDGTWEVLKEIASKDNRIIIIKNQCNLGLAGALNNCISQAQGDYLARQDADDVSVYTRLEEQVAYMDAHSDIAVLGTFMSLFGEDGFSWGINRPPINPSMLDWIKGSAVIHASVMMRRNDIESIGRYNERAIRVEDYNLWMRMISRGYQIRTLPRVLYNVHWDYSDYSRKAFKHRITEAKVRLSGYKQMQISFIYYIYVLKPIFAGLIPRSILYLLHRYRYKQR